MRVKSMGQKMTETGPKTPPRFGAGPGYGARLAPAHPFTLSLENERDGFGPRLPSSPALLLKGEGVRLYPSPATRRNEMRALRWLLGIARTEDFFFQPGGEIEHPLRGTQRLDAHGFVHVNLIGAGFERVQ